MPPSWWPQRLTWFINHNHAPAGLPFVLSSVFFVYVLHEMGGMVWSAIRAEGVSENSSTAKRSLIFIYICTLIIWSLFPVRRLSVAPTDMTRILYASCGCSWPRLHCIPPTPTMTSRLLFAGHVLGKYPGDVHTAAYWNCVVMLVSCVSFNAALPCVSQQWL